MAKVRQVFRKSSEILASYDFFDVASREAYITLYGGMTFNPAAYILTRNQFKSMKVMTATTLASATPTVVHTVAFDIIFNAPARIRNKIIVTVPYGTLSLVNGASTSATFITVSCAHVTAGGTETQIGTSEATETLAQVIAAAGEFRNATGTVAITAALTKFKPNEIFRVKCAQTGSDNAANNSYFYLGHDPAGRDKTHMEANTGLSFGTDTDNLTTSSQMVVYLPMVVDA